MYQEEEQRFLNCDEKLSKISFSLTKKIEKEIPIMIHPFTFVNHPEYALKVIFKN